MGSDLYSITVAEKRGCTVVFDVQCIHPDVLYVLDDPGFALMLLHGAAPPDSALATEVSLDDVMNAEWAARYAKGFIAQSQADAVENELPPQARGDADHPYWEGTWLRWRLEVRVTADGWVDHIAAGQRWPSRAFSPARSYRTHPPIPSAPRQVQTDPEGMFVWVPRECFCGNVERWAKLPPLLEMPAWPESRYTTVDTTTSIDASWVGVPVGLRSRYAFGEIGVVAAVEDAEAPLLLKMGRHSYGASQGGFVTIGRLQPLQSARPGEKLDYGTVLARASTTITGVLCDGAVAQITLRLPPDGRATPVQTASDALDVLLAPLWKRRDEELVSVSSPLATALIADGVSLQLETHRRLEEVIPQVALRYIEGFTLHPSLAPAPPNLDTSTHDEAREALLAPWPTQLLEVRVTDPRWLAHLSDVVEPVAIRDRPLPEPRLEGPPLHVGPPPEPDERVVMWRDGRFRETWLAERRGSVTREWSGRRERQDRTEVSDERGTAEAATRWLGAEASRREKRGFQRLPTASSEIEAVEATLGLRFAATQPPVVAEARDPAGSAEDTTRFRAGDHLIGIGVLGSESYVHVLTVEELGAALGGQRGRVYVWYTRPASGTTTSVSLQV